MVKKTKVKETKAKKVTGATKAKTNATVNIKHMDVYVGRNSEKQPANCRKRVGW